MKAPEGSFIPTRINHEWEWDDTTINLLLSKSSYYLGVLNAMTKYLPNAALFFSMAVVKEAQKSNEIEGTMTELVEILDGTDKSEEARRRHKQVTNYMEAAHGALFNIKRGKFDERLLLGIHKDIIGSKNGSGIRPGKYKEKQNWIGGSTKYDAKFVPAPPKEVKSLMKDLTDFLNNADDVPDLIKIGIAHYQFETIHPFDDGNGRVGRLMIPLYLIHKKILDYPLFVSHFFAEQRRNYYDNLDLVRWKDDLKQWIRFFLVAIKESAKSTIKNIEQVNALQYECEKEVKERYKSNSAHALNLLNILFQKPIMDSKQVAQDVNVSAATANSLLATFEEIGLLNEVTGNKRNRRYHFSRYFNVLLEKREVRE